MANITEILGTDSVSSSRPTINSNFELLNDELASITALLDPTTATLSSVTSITAQTLTLTNGSTSIVLNPSTGATFGADTTFSKTLNAGGKLIKSGTVGTVASGSTDVAPASLAASTYIMGSAVTSLAIPAGDEGQEITIISTSASALAITAASGALLGATSISLDGLNSTVTLRCFSTKWFVIASHNATIA
jgi:hypothetical protein